MLQYVRAIVYFSPLFFLSLSCTSTSKDSITNSGKIGVTLPTGPAENGWAYGRKEVHFLGLPGVSYYLTDLAFYSDDFNEIRGKITKVIAVPERLPNPNIQSVDYENAKVTPAAAAAGQSDTFYLAFEVTGESELVYFQVNSYILWGDMDGNGIIDYKDWNKITGLYLSHVGDIGPDGEVITKKTLDHIDRNKNGWVDQGDLMEGDNESSDFRKHSILDLLNRYAEAHPVPRRKR